MGQYYYTVNIDKKEYIHPHRFGDGLKLMEFGLSGMGTLAGLAMLLADGNGRGGGDINGSAAGYDPVSEIIGRWAGDRIVVAGDYADNGRFIKARDLKGLVDKDNNPITSETINLQSVAEKKFKDISFRVIFALMADDYVRQEFMKKKSSMDGDIINDFNMIHEKLTHKPGDLVLLVGRLKSNEGKTMLERFLKLEQKKEVKATRRKIRWKDK